MRIFIIQVVLLFAANLAQAQVTYIGLPNLIAPVPPANSVNLSTDNSTEFRGIYDITLKPGFEVTQAGNTNANKYFWAYIEYFPTNVQYALLDKELTSNYVPTVYGVLYFAYDEKYTTGVLNYQIYDYMHNPLITPTIKSSVAALNLSRYAVGKNLFQIDMNLIPGLMIGSEAQKYFTLEIINDKNEKFVLRFKNP